jgi:alkanesulfonate monooxygenase SsuD/methylene tetrahydromethanopterin reductase-like flavin-dependent oxidoreductase (luciferase family)
MGRREGLSIRQLARHFAGARGHWQLIGTPASIADEMEARFRGAGADGFNIMPALFPGGLDDFITLVVPELRRRGLFRDVYEASTLRGNLGVKVPRTSPAV